MTTVLVVDDESSIVEVLTTLLEEEGYHVVSACNGEEGLACLARAQPEIVLCDVMMPVLDGREMCKRMQANPLYRSIPIVLMSAISAATKLVGCNYTMFLAKPFDLEEVITAVATLSKTSSSS
ncbi:MAG: response regulator [Ktedonobacteraceae bacterium]|nr:response regulator [Ktedonobacteraceae bacterium]